MPSSSTACVRFFSSSSSSSGTKPSVRKSEGGMLATARRCVSAPRKLARSAVSSSARLPSWEPLYASRIFRYFMAFSSSGADYSQRPAATISIPPMLDVSRSDFTAAVAGAGTMGRGIAQVLAQCGARTLLYDAQPGAAQRGLDSISQALAKLAEKGRVKDPQSIVQRIEVVPGLQAFAPCHLVVEAIVEDLAAKRVLLCELEGIVSES